MDADAKQRVKDALRARIEAQIASSRQESGDEHASSFVDEDTSYSVDDLSQSDQDAELGALLGDAGDRQEAGLQRLDAVDFAPTSTVGPGAIIAFGGDHYVVGVVADAFECDGVTYEGISSDSPVYAAIEGLTEGDTFAVGGLERRLDLVT